MKKAVLGFPLLLAASLPAQTMGILAYPQDTTTNSQGHVAPLGHNATRGFDESRFQQLIPARYLPGVPSRLQALSVVGAAATATVTYDRLEIRIGHATGHSLAAGFDANFVDPVTVLEAPGASLSYGFEQWSDVPFEREFEYDGASPIVVEIRKRIRLDPLTTSETIVATRMANNPGRSDLPVARFSFGEHGSGVIDAEVATHALPAPMCVRLHTSAETLTVRSDRGGDQGNVFALDSSVAFRIHAGVDTHFAMLGAPGFVEPFATPPIGGLLHLPVTLVLPVASGPSNSPPVELAIPNDESLVGYRAAFQAAILDFVAGSIVWTNAVDFYVNP